MKDRCDARRNWIIFFAIAVLGIGAFVPACIAQEPATPAPAASHDAHGSSEPPANPLTANSPPLAWLERAQAMTDLRRADSTPFHLRMTFTAAPGVEQSGPGTYEETWMSADKWRRAVSLGDYHALETRNGAKHYFQANSDYVPSRVLLLVQQFKTPFIVSARTRPDKLWKLVPLVFEGRDYVRLEVGGGPSQLSDFAPLSDFAQIVFSASGMPLSEAGPTGSTAWGRALVEFGGTWNSRCFTVSNSVTKNLLAACITVLEKASTTADAYFNLPVPEAELDATFWLPLSGGGLENVAITHVVEAQSPKGFRHQVQIPGYQYQWVNVLIDKQGRPRDAELVASTSDDLGQSGVDAVRRYTYKPASVGGHPCEEQVLARVEIAVF